jgi:hypothetical protein
VGSGTARVRRRRDSSTLRGRWCHGLREDDGATGPGMAWVDGVMVSGMARGAQRRGLGEDNNGMSSGIVMWAWGHRMCGRQRHWLGSGKMAAYKGARPWSGTTAWRLQRGIDDGGEAPRRTRRRCELHGNFQLEILAA